MDTRDIVDVRSAFGVFVFVFRDGSVIEANEIARSLYEEVITLRYCGNNDCTKIADEMLDLKRKQKNQEDT